MPLYRMVQQAVSKVQSKAEEKYWPQIDRFIVDWLSSITPEQLKAALQTDTDPTMILLDEQFKADIWSRVPFLADHAIYRFATPARIRRYVEVRLPVVAPEHYAAIAKEAGLTEKLVRATRLVLKELFN